MDPARFLGLFTGLILGLVLTGCLPPPAPPPLDIEARDRILHMAVAAMDRIEREYVSAVDRDRLTELTARGMVTGENRGLRDDALERFILDALLAELAGDNRIVETPRPEEPAQSGPAQSEPEPGNRKNAPAFNAPAFNAPVCDGAVTARLPAFTHTVTRQVRDWLRACPSGQPTALLLDLRGHGGGLLDAIPGLAGLFLPGGNAFSVRYRDTVRTHRIDGPPPVLSPGIPLIILTDDKTAAGAELLTRVLQFHRRALVAGRRTAGNDTIHGLFPVGSGNRWLMRLLVGRSLFADGQPAANGVRPDLALTAIAPTTDDTALIAEWRRRLAGPAGSETRRPN